MSLLNKLGTKSSATHCTAPTGKHGRHCGKRIRLGRYGDGVTCGAPECQLWRSCAEDRKTNQAKNVWE
ncbi:hypothetical protein C8D87_11755 [Lentzea atacamensis]|uniref:Uncharacterized protein n=1 Tax=Lentzea atacamensis TaxID=531938 RepID=A0ABX9DV24_9PSEU|nr:hypothetical protein [Lentzea atacamensis]RAS58885.1 hypothetical protein C8D87_11755 [Lentzea atacamensis]